MSHLSKIIAIVGPTASGKTRLSIAVAERFNGEIISADSRQIYRGMDIGTAKPSKTEMRGIPHHLIDIKDPNEDYTVAQHKEDAIAAIQEVLAKKKLPILVGGTGLYLRAVLENLNIPKTKADPALRQRIENDIKEKGLEKVFAELVALDPDAANLVDGKNPRRVTRALEVAIATGIPFTAQQKKDLPLFDAFVVGIDPGSEILREHINTRIGGMITDGLEDEVEKLIKTYGSDCQAFDAIGYREMIEREKGMLTLDAAVALIKINTWQYARRQMTWFRKDKNIHWIKTGEEAFPLIENFLVA